MSERLTDEEFVRLFSAHQRPLFLYILPLVGSTSDADEVLQETSVIMWGKRHQFQPGTSFLAWARAIARLEVFRFRRRHRGRTFSAGGDLLEQIAEKSEQVCQQAEARQEALRECLKRLRPHDRRLIQLRYLPGASGDDVARQTGRPVNSVYQSLSRIRQKLADCIERRLAAGGDL